MTNHNINSILSALTQIDVNASQLPINRAIASRRLVNKLWDELPDERDCYQFHDIEEQTNNACDYLPSNDFRQTVTLHLGWDVISFDCSLKAAWYAWKDFSNLKTETFNCCIYPENLEWYIIRAGYNLYPMTYSGDRYVLKNKKDNL